MKLYKENTSKEMTVDQLIHSMRNNGVFVSNGKISFNENATIGNKTLGKISFLINHVGGYYWDGESFANYQSKLIRKAYDPRMRIYAEA